MEKSVAVEGGGAIARDDPDLRRAPELLQLLRNLKYKKINIDDVPINVILGIREGDDGEETKAQHNSSQGNQKLLLKVKS
jgi:hypothetical protein